MNGQLPFRIFRVVEREPVPVFMFVTTVVATDEHTALCRFRVSNPSLDSEKFVTQGWGDHGPPKLTE